MNPEPNAVALSAEVHPPVPEATGPVGGAAATLTGRTTATSITRRFLRTWRGQISAVLLLILLVVAIFGSLLAPDNPTTQTLSIANLNPSMAHLFGTDAYGRDILSRIMVGLRPSLLIGLGASTLGAVIGLTFGLIAGTERRFAGPVLLRLADLELALPFYIVAIAVAASVGSGLLPLFILLTLWGWPAYTRTIANEVVRVRQEDFVVAARLSGTRAVPLLFRHVTPNVLAPAVVLWSGTIGYVILAESALDFIGLGLKSPQFSLGTMLNDAEAQLGNTWPIVVFPGVVLAITVIAFNLFGDALRDALNPLLRHE